MSKYSLVVVGCGASGSNLIALASQLAISEQKLGEIILIDGDAVEAKNFRNQKFVARDVNKNKARVLSNRYSKLGIDVSYIDRYIDSSKDLISIIKDCKYQPLLVGCVDNNKCRIYMHETFHSEEVENLIYIDTGNGDGDQRDGQTICGIKAKNKIAAPPVGDIFPQALIEEEEEIKDTFKCSEIEKHTQHFATNVLSATTTFLMISNIICLGKVGCTFATFNSDEVSIKKIK